MAMPQAKPKSFTFLVCPVCDGTGREGQQECSRCRSQGSYLWLEGDYYYWNKKIDIARIFEEELERTARILVNAFLVFFGIIGLVFAFLAAYRLGQTNDFILKFFQQRNSMMGVFSVSLLLDLYVYYRMKRESILSKEVRQKTFESFKTEADEQALFDSMATVDKRKVVEISSTLTLEAEHLVDQAWQLARKLKHSEAKPIHLLAVLPSSTKVRTMAARLGLDARVLNEKIAKALARIQPDGKTSSVLSSGFKKLLLDAYKEAYYTRQPKIDAPQLLVAAIEMDATCRDIFYDMEKELDQVRNVAEWINIQEKLSKRYRSWRSRASHKPKGVMNKAMTARATPLLDRFSHDMTSLARAGALTPSITRERETEEAFRILEGGKNVLLVGNPGVGKTSIVEGVAELMASEEVPPILQDKRLVSLSVASLAGTSGRQGELEGRLFDIINEVVTSGNIILFVDSIHNMVGFSTQSAENLDVSDILAQALNKRLFLCVATTTPLDYKRYIEKSGALMDVFTKVNVEEPSVNEAIKILEGKAGAIEYKNQVYFSYEAIERTVKMSDRYIHDRYLPEKAINILEEVAVYARKKRGKNTIVVGEDVAEIISHKTKIPLTRITEKESDKLLNLEEIIHQRMVDQEEAVKAVSTALRRARAELRDIRRPIVNLLFLGPTGVGKTELAKTVAEVYFGSEDSMIRLDMSEYQEKSSINRLIGAPPGYEGSSEGGYLTDAVRTNPFSLLLLDEIEKAHPDILNIFLQVMDDGRLTDTVGRTIDFTNVILIGTSNAGTPLIQKRMKEGANTQAIKEELINEALGDYFRPEFLNRFDNIIVFKPLSMEEIVKIAGLLLKQVAKLMAAKGITLKATPEAIQELAQIGFDPVFGARPLRRAIQEQVDNALANFLLQGKLGRRDVAILEPGGQIRVETASEI